MNLKSTGMDESWDEQKDKLKEMFSDLFENKHLFTESSKEELMAELQIKLSKTKSEILDMLSKN